MEFDEFAAYAEELAGRKLEESGKLEIEGLTLNGRQGRGIEAVRFPAGCDDAAAVRFLRKTVRTRRARACAVFYVVQKLGSAREKAVLAQGTKRTGMLVPPGLEGVQSWEIDPLAAPLEPDDLLVVICGSRDGRTSRKTFEVLDEPGARIGGIHVPAMDLASPFDDIFPRGPQGPEGR